jgi:hypothetical protein
LRHRSCGSDGRQNSLAGASIRQAEPRDLDFSFATLARANQEHLDSHCSRPRNVNLGGTLDKP